MKTKFMKFLKLIICCIGLSIVFHCNSSLIDNKSFDKLVYEESRKTIRYDSIVYGVKLGMTYDDFYYYVFKGNREGLFLPSRGGTMVKIDLNEGFDYPVQFDFFPNNIQGNSIPINEYKAHIHFKNYSIYNKEMSIDNLLEQTIRFFLKGYRGNKFIKVPNTDDIFVKYNYVKIDGNRKILIKPSSVMGELNILFRDLKPKVES